jgi:hypothetical protein
MGQVTLCGHVKCLILSVHWPLSLRCWLQVQMPAGATPQHGGRLTAQDVISSDLITFSSMQVGCLGRWVDPVSRA